MPHNFTQVDLEAIAASDAFRALSPEDIRKLARIGRFIEVRRGDILVRQGDVADVLYYVLNGRFAVQMDERPGQINEIRRGEPIGEIAFFRGGLRTANVRARRDSLVLAFDHEQMDELARSAPRFSRAILTSLAGRLAEATPRLTAQSAFQPPHTIAVVGAGNADVPDRFVDSLVAGLRRRGKTQYVRSGDVPQRFCPPAFAEPHDVTGWIEAVEDETPFAIFDTRGMDDAFVCTLLPVMDCILLVADASGDPACNRVETFVAENCGECDIRLVLLHGVQAAVHQGTASWLAPRTVKMHHHIVPEAPEDLARLVRFLTGHALGFVASGGGAACAAQVGVYKAFRERGVHFDIFGGTSAGAAMAAAFAHDLEASEIDARVGDIFITRKAMGKLTIPRYSLFDHLPFDDALRAHFGETDIEDLHRPFFALSTNLSTGKEHVHRTGKVWQAVRASGAIPGLLPPFYTDKGEMLVDGCLIDNVPVRVMHGISAGPNVIVAFQLSKATYFNVAYHELPGRWQIASTLSGVMSRKPLPDAPGIAEVLMRSLTLSHDTELTGSHRDVVIIPPVSDDIGIMSWEKHTQLMEQACLHTRGLFVGRVETEQPALSAILAGAEFV